MNKQVDSPSYGFWMEDLRFSGLLKWFDMYGELAEMLLFHSPTFYVENEEGNFSPNCSTIIFWKKVIRINRVSHTNGTWYAASQSKVALTPEDIQKIVEMLGRRWFARYRIGSASHALSFELSIEENVISSDEIHEGTKLQVKDVLDDQADKNESWEEILSISRFRKLKTLYEFLIKNNILEWRTWLIRNMVENNTDIESVFGMILESSEQDWKENPIRYLALFEIVEDWYEEKSWKPLGFKWLEEPVWYEEHLWF